MSCISPPPSPVVINAISTLCSSPSMRVAAAMVEPSTDEPA